MDWRFHPGSAGIWRLVRDHQPRRISRIDRVDHACGDYPADLDALLATLADAGVAPTGENTVAGYAYDPETVEFTLCVETPSGAWATYDTEPMSLRQGAETGGCPELS